MSYNSKVDYSEIAGGKILPFVVELDLPNCIFAPESGKNQKFSYIVTATGSSDDLYGDLEYIILGIDEKITFSQLENITIYINEKSQKVRYDKNNNNNVSLVSADEHTGCAGLKFEFELGKKNDVMNISFELSETYEVGSIYVCLYGQETAKTGLTIGGPTSNPDDSDQDNNDQDNNDQDNNDQDNNDQDNNDQDNNDQDNNDQDNNDQDDNDQDDKDNNGKDDIEWFDTQWDKFSYKFFNIYVPVSVKPYAKTYEPDVKYLGDVEIFSGCKHCDKECESCDFTIAQKVSVKVPVKYGVSTHYEKTCMDEEETDVE